MAELDLEDGRTLTLPEGATFDEAQRALTQFRQEEESQQGRGSLRTLGSGFVSGIVGGAGAAASGIAGVLGGDDPKSNLNILADEIAKSTEETIKPFGPRPDETGFFDRTVFGVGSGLGSIVPSIGIAAGAATLGAPAGAAILTGGVFGGLIEGGALRIEAREKGVDPGTANKQAIAMGVGSALLNAGALGNVLRAGGSGLFARSSKAVRDQLFTGGPKVRKAKAVLTAGLAEAGTEALEEPLSDIIQGTPITFDTVERMAAVAVPSFIIGGGIRSAQGIDISEEEKVFLQGRLEAITKGQDTLEDFDISQDRESFKNFETEGRGLTRILPAERRNAILAELQSKEEISENLMPQDEIDNLFAPLKFKSGKTQTPRAKTVRSRLKVRQQKTGKKVAFDQLPGIREGIKTVENLKVPGAKARKIKTFSDDTEFREFLEESDIIIEDQLGGGFNEVEKAQLSDLFRGVDVDLKTMFVESFLRNSLQGTGTTLRKFLDEHFLGGGSFTNFGEFKTFVSEVNKGGEQASNLIQKVLDTTKAEKVSTRSFIAKVKKENPEADISSLEKLFKNKSSISKAEIRKDLLGEDIIQKQIEEEGGRGAIAKLEDPERQKAGRFLIAALDSPDFSTSIHEFAHFVAYTTGFNTSAPLQQMMTKANSRGESPNNWTKDEHEEFAEDFERYLLQDNPAFGREYSKETMAWVQDEMREVYQSVRGLSTDLTNEDMRRVYDVLVLGYNPAETTKIIEEVGETQTTIDPLISEQSSLGEKTGVSRSTHKAWKTQAFKILEDPHETQAMLSRETTVEEDTALQFVLLTLDGHTGLVPNGMQQEYMKWEGLRGDLENKVFGELREAGQKLNARRFTKAHADAVQLMRIMNLQNDPLFQRILKVNPEQVAGYLKTMRDSPKSTLAKNIGLTMYYNSLLSNPSTSFTNLVGNTIFQWYLIGDRVLQGVVDSAWSKVTGNKRNVFASEGLQLFKTWFQGSTQIKAGKAFKSALKDNELDLDVVTALDDEVNILERQALERFLTERYGRTGTQVSKVMTFFTRNLVATDLYFKSIAETSQKAALYDRFGKFEGDARRKEMFDFIKREAVNQENLRISKKHAKRYVQGLTYTENIQGKDVRLPVFTLTEDNDVRSLAGLRKLTDEDVLRQLDDLFAFSVEANTATYAEHATFQDPLGPIAQNVQKIRNQFGPLGRVTMPFIRTIANLSKRGIELTPGIGLAGRAAGLINTPGRELFTKQMEGMFIAYTVWNMMEQGLLTGPPPEDPTERDAFFRQGKQAESFKLGDTWVSYRRFDPFSLPMSIMGSLFDDWKNADSQRTGEEAFFRAASIAASLMVDGSYLRGVRDVVGGEERRFTQALPWMASGIVPYSGLWRFIAAESQVVDRGSVGIPNRTTYMDSFGQSLPPGVLELLGGEKPEDRINVFGEDIRRPSTFFQFQEWLPVQFRQEVADDVESALQGLKIYPGFPSRSRVIEGVRIRLSDDTYKELIVNTGLRLKRVLNEIVTGVRYKQMDEVGKSRLVKKTIQRVRDQEWRKIKPKVRRALRSGELIL